MLEKVIPPLAVFFLHQSTQLQLSCEWNLNGTFSFFIRLNSLKRVRENVYVFHFVFFLFASNFVFIRCDVLLLLMFFNFYFLHEKKFLMKRLTTNSISFTWELFIWRLLVCAFICQFVFLYQNRMKIFQENLSSPRCWR